MFSRYSNLNFRKVTQKGCVFHPAHLCFLSMVHISVNDAILHPLMQGKTEDSPLTPRFPSDSLYPAQISLQVCIYTRTSLQTSISPYSKSLLLMIFLASVVALLQPGPYPAATVIQPTQAWSPCPPF